MNAERELLRAYSEWRRLAEAEGKAIAARNWQLLADCQHAIQDFQKHVSRLSLDAREEWKRAGADIAAKEKFIQRIVGELIEITRHNHAKLVTARDAAKQRLEELGTAGRNLKQLHKSYAPAREKLVLETA